MRRKRKSSPRPQLGRKLHIESLECRRFMAAQEVDDVFTAVEDQTFVAPRSVLANDTSAHGAASLVSQPLFGRVNFSTDGKFTYIPGKDFCGTDSFDYSVVLDDGSLAQATAFLIVAPVNDVPVAAADAYQLDQGTNLTLPPSVLTANDTDAECNPLSTKLVSSPTNGKISIGEDGTFIYDPNPGFQGQDSFTYSAFDGQATSRPVQVTLTVRPNTSSQTVSGTLNQYSNLLDAAAMLRDLRDAIASGQSTYTIAPGVYDFTGQTQQFRLQDVKDFTINAANVTFLFSPRVDPIAVYLNHCQNVRLAGLTIDYSPLPFTQGTIQEIHSDGSFVVRLDADYPLLDASWTKAGGGNAKTIVFGPDGSMRPQIMDWLATAQSLGGRDFLCTTQQNWLFRQPGTQIAVGDKIAFPDRQFRQTIQLRDSTDCTLEGVTLWSAPQMGFVQSNSSGTTFLNCDIIRKPGSNRLLSSNADGIFSIGGSRTQIISSRLEYTGDDMVNLHSKMQYVFSNRQGLVWSLDDLRPGQTVDLVAKDGSSLGQVTISAVRELSDASLIARAQQQAKAFGVLPVIAARMKAVQIEFTTPVTTAAMISNPALLPTELVVKDSTFIGGYSRGVIFSGSGSIEGNTFEQMGSASIWVGADAKWGVGPIPRDVLIVNSVIRNSNQLLHRMPQNGAITIGNALDQSLFGTLVGVDLVDNQISGSIKQNVLRA